MVPIKIQKSKVIYMNTDDKLKQKIIKILPKLTTEELRKLEDLVLLLIEIAKEHEQ